MRILLANTRHFLGGGESTYTFNLADLLRAKGHKVAFFAMQDQRNFPDINDDLFVSNIDFKKKNQNKHPINAYHVLKRSIYSNEARKKFSNAIARLKPDIVHLQNIHNHITPSIIFEAKKNNLPVLWTLHDYKIICPNSIFLNDSTGKICESCGNSHFYRAIFRRCKKGSILATSMAVIEAYSHRMMGVQDKVDCLLVPSAFLKMKLLEVGIPWNKVKQLPYLLAEAMFHKSNKDEGYLLFIGRLNPIKGIYPLLRACKISPKIRLILAGRVDEQFVSQLSDMLPDNTKYVGMKQGDELKNLLLGARAVVVPSLWYENQPFSIIEAFAAGKPVIASDLGGMAELLKGEERGILVTSGNVEALAKAMQWMAKHPKEAYQMGKKAQEYAYKVHNSELHYEKLSSLYHKYLGRDN